MAQYGSKVCIGGFRSEPTSGRECLEAIWTRGKSCKECPVECYRQGMTARQATIDNKRLVEATK